MAFVTMALSPAVAVANGRFPAAQEVFVGPGSGSTTIVLRTTFGLAVSDDGGTTFHWICEGAFGLPQASTYDPPIQIDAMGGIEVGTFIGLYRTSADRCMYPTVTALANAYIADLDGSSDGMHVYAVTSAGNPGAMNGVYRSDDAGQTFQSVGAGLANVLFDTLEVARTDPNRIYLTGVAQNPTTVTVYRSDDGGLTIHPVAFTPDPGAQDAYIAAIDPTNEDVVYLREALTATSEAGLMDAGTTLWKTVDGGMTWAPVMHTVGSMKGFAISDDGQTLWLGSDNPADGLQRSTNGGMTWQRIGNQHVLCLREHGGVLYLCANFAMDGFALGRSTDEGGTFQPLLRFQDLQAPVSCDPSSPIESVCRPEWPALQAMFAPPPMMDAGMADEMPAAPSGCHCHASTGARGGPWTWTTLLAIAGASAMRRRRRTTRS